MSSSRELLSDLVSIIMPAYNSEEFIIESINSVINQSYEGWELIIVDDHSSDNTVNIINKIEDSRIQLIELDTNQGAAIARNIALEQIKGEYIAFLDSDDKWDENKLEIQLSFMKENNYVFTSTTYDEVDEVGNKTGVTVNSRKKLNYDGVLKYCPGNSTVIYNAKELGVFYIPNIRKRNDFVMWLQVIKKAKFLYGIDRTLTHYRVREDSLSVNKKSLIKYQWKVYRDIEDLSLIKSCYLLVHKIASILLRKKAAKF